MPRNLIARTVPLHEAGRVLSKKNEQKLKDVVSKVQELLDEVNDEDGNPVVPDGGASQADGGTEPATTPAKRSPRQKARSQQQAAEAARVFQEAADILRMSDSLDARQQLVSAAIRRSLIDPADPYGSSSYAWVRDMFDDVAVFAYQGDLFAIEYAIDDSGDDPVVTLGATTEVELSYVAVEDTDDDAPNLDGITATDDSLGGPAGTMEAAKPYPNVPDGDFAGKNRSYPIAKPKDVADAAASIGRAGPDNYTTDELKSRIIAIAKRKGPKFLAKLPKAWQTGGQKESGGALLVGDFVPLVEAAAGLRRDGTVPICLITPGWGSSGYYSPEVLKRDAGVFPAGTKMFWNHQTPAEEAQRPEGNLNDLAAVLASPARWDDNGAKGPGLYADAKVFEAYQKPVADLANDIGVSIRALGRSKMGEAEGRKGPIIQQLAGAKSVDFVTDPGRGGAILPLFEAARQAAHARTHQGAPSGGPSKEDNPMPMTEAEANALRDENARLREAAILRESRDFVAANLPTNLADLTRNRLIESLGNRPVLKDGVLDRDGFKAAVEKAVADEVDYLAKVTGSGRIVGMGSVQESAGGTTPDTAALTDSMTSAFQRIGLRESTAKIAASGR